MSHARIAIEKRTADFKGRLAQSKILFYVSSVLISMSVCYLLYILFPQYTLYWSMVSVMLVLSPEGDETNKLALDRMNANIIGSVVGLVAFTLFQTSLLALSVAVIVTILICFWFNLGVASRSALACVIIVMVQEHAQSSWMVAVERVICVVVGCAIAISVSILLRKVLVSGKSL